MKEPTVTPEIAESFARQAMTVKPGNAVSRADAVCWLPVSFKHEATWTYQKETAEMLLSVLVVAGIYTKDNYLFRRNGAP